MMMKVNWIVKILSEFKVLCYLKDSKNKLEIYSVWIFCSWERVRNIVLEECFIVLTAQLLIYYGRKPEALH